MKRLWRWLWFVLAFGMIVLLASIGHKGEDDRVFVVKDALDPMAQLLEPHARQSLQLLNPYLQSMELAGIKGMAVVYGTQAAAYREQSSSSGYFPLYQASVVIAVNRLKNPGHAIHGWKSMLSSDAVVLIPSYITEAGRLVSIALARALGAEEGHIGPAIEAWAHLQSQNRMNPQSEYGFEQYRLMYQPDHLERYDAIVLWDYQAKVLQQMFAGWDVITPAEGTLTVDCGLLYGPMSQTQETLIQTKNFLLSEEGRQQLKEAGFSPFDQQVDLSPWDATRLTYGPKFRRSVLQAKLYSPASVLERTVLQSTTLLLFAIASLIILRRVPRGLYRSSSYYTLLFLLLWILFGTIKTITFSDTLTRYIWYATYLPRHAVPLGWYCMCHLNRSGCLPPKKRLYLFGSIALLLTLFVCTNDVHRRVFVFQGSNPTNWDVLYTNNWGYYLSLLWSFALSAAGIVLLFRGKYSRRQKRLLLYAAGVFVLLLTYQALYIAGVRYILDLDIPTTVSITLLLFILASQRERFMHASLFALPIFENSPYAIAVYNKSRGAEYSNTAMLELMQKESGLLKFEPALWDSTLRVPIAGRIFRNRIHNLENGCALVLEDITGIQRLEQELQTTGRKLNAAKRLLSRQIKETWTLTGAIERERITQSMDRLFLDKLSALRTFLYEINVQTVVIPTLSIRRARLLLFICQHRLRFTIRSLEARTQFPVELASRYINGLGKDLAGLDVDNTVTTHARGSCKACILTYLLEVVDHIFLCSFGMQGTSLVLHLTTNNDGLELSAVLSWEHIVPVQEVVLLPKHLIDTITLQGGQVHVDDDDEGLFARVVFQYAEVRDDLV